MSALLTLAALAGVTFDCAATGVGVLHLGGQGFSVFAPAERAEDGYRVSGPEKSYFNPDEFEQVEDSLPESLMLVWRREHNSPVALTIADHDAAAGTARFTVGTERNPASALHTPLTYEGTCQVRHESGEGAE